MLSSLDSIKTFIRVNKAHYWKLHPFQNFDVRISEFQNGSIEESVEKIESVISLIQDQRKFTIVCSEHETTNSQKKGVYTIDIILQGSVLTKVPIPEIKQEEIKQLPSLSGVEIEHLVNEKLEAYKKDLRIAQLEEQLESKGTTNSFDRALTILEKALKSGILSNKRGGFSHAIGSQQTTIETERQQPTNENQSDEQLLHGYISRMIKVCLSKQMNPLTVFKELTEIIEKDPDLLEDLDMLK